MEGIKMDIDNLNLDELKNIDINRLTDKERKLLKKKKKLLKKQKRREEENKSTENEKKGKRKRFIAYSIILIVSLFLGYFMYSIVVAKDTVTGEVTESLELTGETKEITMTAQQWKFIPNTITVNQGDRVILNIDSVDVAHGIALPQFGINENLVPGKRARIEFIADKKGKFPFICSVYCGAGHGAMQGRVIVE